MADQGDKSVRLIVFSVGVVTLLLIIVCGLAGYYGVRSLSTDLDYMADKAWPAADGAMETEIYLFQQATIARRMLMEDTVKTENLRDLYQARKRTDEAAAQMRQTGLITTDLTTTLDVLLQRFDAQMERVLALYQAPQADVSGERRQQLHQAEAELELILTEFSEFIPLLDRAADRTVDNHLAEISQSRSWLVWAILLTTSMAMILVVIAMVILRDYLHRYRSQLQEASRQVERSSESKSEFLAHMSHEVRTPMNGVMGMLSLLKTSKLDTRQADYVETAINSGRMMLSLLNDVLDLSRVEAGKLALENHPLPLIDVCEQVSALMANSASEKAVELVCDLAPDLPAVVLGDETRLRQVLGNLLGNSVKFTGSGEVVLSVTTESRTDDEAVIRFAISDTGIGIDQKSLAEIFKAFTQADASVNRNYGGTGLGLAISSRLVRLMGSRIEVESWPGIGSRFWFSVPFPIIEDVQNFPPVAPEERDKRILICNDSRSTRRVIEEMLAMWGYYQFDVEETAERALESMRYASEQNMPYDIVIIDDDMPGTEALTVARSLKTNLALGEPRLIVLVSDSQDQKAMALKSIGLASLVCKPLRRASLYEALTGIKAVRETGPAPVEKELLQANLLLVEDDRVNQKVVTGMLGSFGCEVDVVDNGMLALAACQSKRYDLILMDCQMPVMDGYQATRELRRLEAGRRRVPIIGITANVMNGDREKCLSAGMDDYIPKPVALGELKEKLEQYLLVDRPLSVSA